MKSKNSIASFIFSSLLLVGLVFAWFNRLAMYDWWRLHNYQPDTVITKIANDDTMTDYAKHMFYINHPVLQDRAAFNQNCPNDGGEQSIILGCYVGNQTGIYLYSVNDPKLAGVEQVTAAHETLHAIYERLSPTEKQNVNNLLVDFYNNGLKDKRIRETVEAYKKSEPNDVVNEMHSVFGSEVSKLPTKLEDHYKKYFEDRAKVINFANKYRKTFEANQALSDKYLQQIKSIENQLKTLKTQIDSKENALRQENSQLEVARKHVNAFNVDEFNRQVNQYNSDVQAYRDLINQYNSLISQHNILVNKLNALNTETDQLYKELDSRSATVSKQ